MVPSSCKKTQKEKKIKQWENGKEGKEGKASQKGYPAIEKNKDYIKCNASITPPTIFVIS